MPDSTARITPSAALDPVMTKYMRARQTPGGALAVVKDGRLVYANGCGWADVGQHRPARPETLFRIASLSKMFTACAVMTLVQRGRLALDTPAFRFLHLTPPPGARVDPRLATITLNQLLHHTGGFDSAKSFDPMFQSARIAKALNVPAPPGPADIVRFMMGQPLDFTPGTRFAYSNFGYCVLGRVIAQASGMAYGDYVQKAVLRPLGITTMRLGRTALKDAWPGEAHYYQPNDGSVPSVYPGQGTVPYPYGGFDLEALDSHGGWVASVLDLVRFAVHGDSLLPPRLVAALYAPPPPPVWRDTHGALNPYFYACGWLVRSVGGGKSNKWHDGSLPGTYSYLVRRADGLTWAAVFNHRTEGSGPNNGHIDPLINNALDTVTAWPPGRAM